MKRIISFRGQHQFLSNFFSSPVCYKGLTFYSAEAAFQAQKCSLDEDKIKYTLVKNPRIAKHMGKREKLPENWDDKSYLIMKDILKEKFSNPALASKLLSTGDAILIEGNHWHDNNWGDCTCEKCANIVGKNKLGTILMSIREELKAA